MLIYRGEKLRISIARLEVAETFILRNENVISIFFYEGASIVLNDFSIASENS